MVSSDAVPRSLSAGNHGFQVGSTWNNEAPPTPAPCNHHGDHPQGKAPSEVKAQRHQTLQLQGVSQGFNSPCDVRRPRLCDNAQSCSGTTGLLRCAIKAHTQTVGRAWILQRTYLLPQNTARHRKGSSEVLLIPEGASSPRKSEEGARSHQRHVSDSPHSPPTAHLELAPQAST